MKVAVIGLGKLGAPLTAVLASKGFRVGAWDVDPAAIERFWTNPPPEPGLQDMIYANRERISTGDVRNAVSGAAAVFIIVPTPSQEDGTFTNAYVLEAIAHIRTALQPATVVNIVSTVMPGSCGGPIREALPPGQPLTFSPEFIALGSVIRDLLAPDYILIGESDKRAGDVIADILRRAADNDPPVHRMGLASAELAKIMTNAFICTKISFANMLADLGEAVGANPHEVAKAVGADHRIGEACLKPGLGFGGPCLPRDTWAVETLAASKGVSTDLVNAVHRSNRTRALAVVEEALSLTMREGVVAVLGQSYKPGTPVVEASQARMISGLLSDYHINVPTYDPMAPCTEKSMQDAVKDADAVIIATPWPEFRDVRRYTDAPVIDPWGLLQ